MLCSWEWVLWKLRRGEQAYLIMALLFRAFDVKNIILRFYIIFNCIVTVSNQGKVCVCVIYSALFLSFHLSLD